jgi:hypothetical protein
LGSCSLTCSGADFNPGSLFFLFSIFEGGVKVAILKWDWFDEEAWVILEILMEDFRGFVVEAVCLCA